MSAHQNGPNETPSWIPAFPTMTREQFIEQSNEEIESFSRNLSRYKDRTRLISSELQELLADVAVSNYSADTMFHCRTRLLEFIQIVNALKAYPPTPHPLDVAQLQRFKADIDEYLDLLGADQGFDEPYWEEQFDNHVGSLRAALPLIAEWEGTKKQPPPPRDAEFAASTDEVPEKFQKQIVVNGKVFTSIRGKVSDLLWKISNQWSSKSGALLTKHISGAVFIKKHGKGNFEAFFPTEGALRDAVKRPQRPEQNPNPRGTKKS
jgi:hypothetical protein